MLKWAVNKKTTSNETEAPRHQTAESHTRPPNVIIGSSKPERRHSSASRRAGPSRRANNQSGSSLCLERDKENPFTSTPIKSGDDFHDALRDVSNLTPNDATNRRTKKEDETPRTKRYKSKKRCLDPSLHQDFVFSSPEKITSNYFRTFESVDSHIEGITATNILGYKGTVPMIISLTPKRYERYAPTLPTFNGEDSPGVLSPVRTLQSPYLKTAALIEPPNKRAKIDHVNDFLHQISFITSPENERLLFMRLNSKNSRDEIEVSPLVKKLVDLRFGRIERPTKINDDSSYINDLSLDKIVDAILDDSNDSAGAQMVEKNERQNSVASSCPSTSDSGFRSSHTEAHEPNDDFKCKCGNNNRSVEAHCDRTIINLDETFNERSVDVTAICNNRKRLKSEQSDESSDFTLKRQKCIRRRKLIETDNKVLFAKSIHVAEIAAVPRENYLNDDSFESPSGLGKIDNKDVCLDGTDNDEKPNSPQNGFSNRRTRRCLSFESPIAREKLNCSEISSSKCRDVENGSMELSVRFDNGQLVVNILRCRDLNTSSGKQINAYVKVDLRDRTSRIRRKAPSSALQRTPVQANSSKPFFNHSFKFAIQNGDFNKRLHLEVWHRNRTSRRSEFLGCMSFAIKNVIKKDISGSYHLLPQSTGRCQNLPITVQYVPDVCALKESTHIEDSVAMCESQSSVEEVMSFEDLENDLKRTTNKTILNQQQKDADENLFLRYLELDPMEGPDAIPAALQRKATGNKNGRTPFTTTKKLIRPSRSGFGFSVVWTHPPRIERVEKGLPADKAGILPGDYIIFVDKHNVVMMPEIDILNLIKSFGSCLTLEIFRRNSPRNGSVPCVPPVRAGSTAGLPSGPCLPQHCSSTVGSTNTTSVEYNRRKLNLPQVTFTAEKPITNIDEGRKKLLFQLVHKEQQYVTGLQFAITRFVSAMAERRDLITAAEHRTLFQNSEDILRITEDILDSLAAEDGDPQVHNLSRIYQTKLSEITSAYKKYCSGIKKADCVLANKTKNSNSDFVKFLQTPAIPRRRPDITSFIHKPLEHYRDVLKIFNVILSSTKSNHEDYPVIMQIVRELQVTYREITAEGGLMEPLGEGRLLLSVQDLENRLVFTKCKPFVLSKPGRQWIFGGDLSRVEGRNVRQYWALLFTDLILFAKVSRDRVLFIMEDPLALAHITELLFNVRKKVNEFRLIIEPTGTTAQSPTAHCGPDLTRTPRRNAGKRCVVLRAPNTELKAVWQNLLQRQIFHVNSGMDSSSLSSPLESPDAPITSSVVTLQSAETLSLRRQTPQCVNQSEPTAANKQLEELIEHKCKQIEKCSSSGKSNAIHLEQWMKGHLGKGQPGTPEEEPECEVWTEEMFRRRTQELLLYDNRNAFKRNEINEETILSDQDQSPSRSTTTESQVTVRSSPVVPETVSVCKQCHRNCLTNGTNQNLIQLNNNVDHRDCFKFYDDNGNAPIKRANSYEQSRRDSYEDFGSLMLMGLSAISPASRLVHLDPFSPKSVPKISVVPPTPDSLNKTESESKYSDCSCGSQNKHPQIHIDLNRDYDNSPDDSPQDEHPYQSLTNSNPALRRYGTVSSLERVGSEEADVDENSSDSDCEQKGIDNEAFNHSAIRTWTARAGAFVTEKLSFFERLGEDYRTGFFERYLRTTEIQVNGEEGLDEECENSGATSGEEIWGTPTSGGETEDPLSSNCDGKRSPNEGSVTSETGDDTELMMDELFMTPPVLAGNMRGLLLRRTLEPLMEEDDSEATSSTSTEATPSPEQGKETGNVADNCLDVAKKSAIAENLRESPTRAPTSQANSTYPKIHRSDSYRHIIEAEDDNASFFNHFRPAGKLISIERLPKSKGLKLLEIFNVRRTEHKTHETFPNGRRLIKAFSKEGTISDEVPTSYSQKPLSPLSKLKDKQDKRFWRQLSRRRGNKAPHLPA